MMKVTAKQLYDMKLFDILVVEDGLLFTTAMRVPGGWIMRSVDKGHGILSSNFVPFNNEFQAEMGW